MKKNELGEKVMILANIGVIFGILLLVFELNQNRELMRAQLRADYAGMLIGQIRSVYENPDLAALMVEGGCAEEVGFSCNSVDDLRYSLYWRGRFRSWENLHYQYRVGLYDEAEFLASREGWRTLLTNPKIAANWSSGRSIYSPEFAAEMDALLPD